MKRKIEVQIRKSSGVYWRANTTHNGYDIFELGKTIEEAKANMTDRLNRRGYEGVIEWSEPQDYPKKGKVENPQIGYAKTRIDNNPIG